MIHSDLQGKLMLFFTKKDEKIKGNIAGNYEQIRMQTLVLL